MVLCGGVCGVGVAGVVGGVCGIEDIFVFDTPRGVIITPAADTMDVISLVHRLRSILGCELGRNNYTHLKHIHTLV